ncbi:MAG: energy transducer TonB [Coxiellaceae bacterium]|nr:MAG: energy transducer TonB [Coxiellaceae bacterium]
MLHVAIQKHQHYPANALQLNKQGRVTLAFTLLTNGYVSNLTVLKSSGVPSLDEAAIAAVKEAVPFSGLEQYLNEAKAFHIDVVFDLGSYDV